MATLPCCVTEDADLAIGAEAIARDCFASRVTVKQVYGLASRGWPIFRIQEKLAARPSSIRAEMARREAAALAIPDETA